MGGINSGRRPATQPITVVDSNQVLPSPPSWLDAIALTEWKERLPELARSFNITPMDTISLATYCHTFSAWRECENAIREEGRILSNGKAHPLLRHSLTLMQEMRRIAGDFGLSPSARKFLPKKVQSDDGDEFLDDTEG